ncbi:MAG: imidazole glycerol phosphate synthase subunit HisF [Bacteroidales bacterium]|nr:MAG: imidazole glycerol phosphate synthase subunit HisF [Bacteroidales bacterium]
MLSKRIIPCLDVKNGRTVKGVNFNNLMDAGDPVQLAYEYYKQGADELVLLDITATLEGRETFINVVKDVAKAISIPFTVGGGISKPEQVEALLKAGADKVSINSAALQNPNLITTLANAFGSQCVVVAIDAINNQGNWEVVSHSGTKETIWDPFEWAKKAESLGAGEILLTSYSSDGTQMGYAIDLTAKISESLKIPVIASGGAGCKEHFLEVLTLGKADAALAAGVFHFGKLSIKEVKQYLNDNGIVIRL